MPLPSLRPCYRGVKSRLTLSWWVFTSSAYVGFTFALISRFWRMETIWRVGKKNKRKAGCNSAYISMTKIFFDYTFSRIQRVPMQRSVSIPSSSQLYGPWWDWFTCSARMHSESSSLIDWLVLPVDEGSPGPWLLKGWRQLKLRELVADLQTADCIKSGLRTFRLQLAALNGRAAHHCDSNQPFPLTFTFLRPLRPTSSQLVTPPTSHLPTVSMQSAWYSL